jgi:hypothetical protein
MKNDGMCKNQLAWQQLFDKHSILDNIEDKGFFEITSTQINEFREARLMTKFDHKLSLPDIFKKNELSILPISRGGYLISHFEAYKECEKSNHDIISVNFPDHIESLDYNNISSEAVAINCAYVSGILRDFIGEEDILPTVSGRMSSNSFDFYIRNQKKNSDMPVGVSNSQIEIDGGLEGSDSLMLLEAKNSLSDDFLVRQLYYPYRRWSKSIKKSVKPVFMTYSNSIFNLYEYRFQEINNYNSLVLVKQQKYSFESTAITLDDIQEVFSRIKIIKESKVPFPQADKFERVWNLCELLSKGDKTKDDVTVVDPRQSDYYINAGCYLGLLDKTGADVFVTDKGKRVLGMRYKERQLRLAELILSHEVFHKTFQKTLDNIGQLPLRNEIVEIMKQSNLYQMNADKTYTRRASTINSWINWILELQR